MDEARLPVAVDCPVALVAPDRAERNAVCRHERGRYQ
jgi:hypothetical protein